jgi:hypothetical protein
MSQWPFTTLPDDILNAFAGRVYVRDWTHAAKNFLPGGMANAGKVKFTFHTWFEINPTAYQPPTGQNYGLLVKSIKLPTFNMDVTELNQYNRKRLIQSKIKYQPIEVTFHDDNASQVTAMWDAYYRYNYADAWNPIVTPFSTSPAIKDYNRRNIYDPSISGDTEYGYRGDARGEGGNRADGGEKVPFFNNITVYGMWAGNFIAYTLINPIITQFDHDTYDYSDGGGTMQNRMTIDYETVVYNSGKIGEDIEDGTGLPRRELNGDLVAGFGGPDSYDSSESPLEQGGNNLIGDFPPAFLGDDASAEDYIRFLRETYVTQGSGLIETAKNQIQNGIRDAVFNALGIGGDTDTPTNGGTPSIVNIANQGTVTGANNNNTQGSPPPAGEQNNGNGTGGA